jgi:N-acetylglucosamine-6-phosphate deacetylase
VRDGVCLAGTTLAGSVLTMDRAVENVQRFTGTSLQVALRLASQNPARMLGLEPLSTVAVGQPANFNVYNPAGERTGQIFRGTPVSPARA